MIKIKLSASKQVEKHQFTIDFEVDSKAWSYWKNDDDKTDEQYIEELISNGLSQQARLMEQ